MARERGLEAKNQAIGVGAGLLWALAVLVLLPATAKAAPGDLDSSFGSGGIVTSDLEDSGASDVAIQSDGKIIAVGSTGGCTEVGEEFTCHSEFLIERYSSNGTLDTSFGGGDGIVTTDFGGESQGASSVLLETSGKLLVGGTTSHQVGFQNLAAFAIARYNSDGTLDTSFGGGDGKVSVEVSGAEAARNWSGSMVLLPSGKIVLGGEVYIHEGVEFATWHFALTRFNSNGSLDTSFGTEGTVVGPIGHEFGLTEEPGGKLLAAGRAGESDLAVARFNSNGSLDTSFGKEGMATVNLSLTGSQADAVLVQPDGKIVASGWGHRIAIVRFNADGAPDHSFGGGDGVTYTDFDRPCCGLGAAVDIALQADGRIVFAGDWHPDEDSFDSEWSVGRLYANGDPDQSFGTNGMVTTDVESGGYGNYANGVAIQSDGKVVAVGSTGEPSQDLAVVRYLGGGLPPPTFHHILITKAGTGEGIVLAPELNCGPNCGTDYEAGEMVELNAFAEEGSSFTGWSTISGNPGTCTGMTTPCEVTLNGDVELKATFGGGSPPERQLTISKSGSGSGTVTSAPAGIACGATCSAEFGDGTEVTLTATPSTGSTFTGWSGGGCAGTGSCKLTLNADSTVTANFTASSGGGEEGPPPGGGSEGGGGGPAPSPSPQTTIHKKPLHCRKGFKKRKVHGKARCVKVKNRPIIRPRAWRRYAVARQIAGPRQEPACP